MESALDSLDLYDVLTFVVLLILAIAVCSLAMIILGLPGKIAIKRRHPHAEGVKLMGWVGFLAVIPWIHALIWAFHDAVTVDLRRFPDEEKKAIDAEIERLGGKKEQSEKLAAEAAPSGEEVEGKPGGTV